MKDITTIDIINSLMAFCALVLSSINFWRDRPKVEVQAQMYHDFNAGGRPIMIEVSVVNNGAKPCRVEGVGIDLVVPFLARVAEPRQVEATFQIYSGGSLVLEPHGGKYVFSSPLDNRTIPQIDTPMGTAYVQLTNGKTIRRRFYTLELPEEKPRT